MQICKIQNSALLLEGGGVLFSKREKRKKCGYSKLIS